MSELAFFSISAVVTLLIVNSFWFPLHCDRRRNRVIGCRKASVQHSRGHLASLTFLNTCGALQNCFPNKEAERTNKELKWSSWDHPRCRTIERMEARYAGTMWHNRSDFCASGFFSLILELVNLVVNCVPVSSLLSTFSPTVLSNRFGLEERKTPYGPNVYSMAQIACQHHL